MNPVLNRWAKAISAANPSLSARDCNHAALLMYHRIGKGIDSGQKVMLGGLDHDGDPYIDMIDFGALLDEDGWERG